ncbi:hypothetical protein XspCFBP7912_03810 [Xanthomonas sp. CFBP 7912]|nr:hypothetical protein XspCFBP7912_03810 [Xanthomonas sp. CFBP 7912]RJS05183.1 hypothetical protein XnspCFBP7698_02825 [Xanthomonas sp. CFBP 7698]
MALSVKCTVTSLRLTCSKYRRAEGGVLTARGAVGGMNAAPELIGTYLQRVLRWWVGKGSVAHARRRGRGALTARGTRR